jgi:hypothetical protein
MIIEKVSSIFRLLRDIPFLLYELNRNRVDNRYVNSVRSYYTMRKLYYLTGGYSVEGFTKFLSANRHPKSAFASGIKCFPRQDPHVLEQLTRMKCYVRGNICEREGPRAYGSVADLLSSSAGRIEVSDEEIFANREIAELITSGPWLNQAREVLGVEPVAVGLTAWWSVPTSREEDVLSEAAQMWHRDIDRLREIKVFFYATDVGPDNGPFEFIEGSHLPSLRAFSLRDGRFSDSEIQSRYPASQVITMTGGAGDAFMVDTQAFHRGKPVEKGIRCLLQLYFSSRIFGAEFLYRPRISLNPSWPSYLIWKRAIDESPITWAPLFNDGGIGLIENTCEAAAEAVSNG